MITLALAGDTMLGRSVAERLSTEPAEAFVSDEVAAFSRDADLFVLNLECCISERGEPWPDPAKPFFFRAPPPATRLLTHLGVSCVTLANNHALDFGADALLDTLGYLSDAGIRVVGAGVDERSAREPVMLEAGGFRLSVIGVADHPQEFAAGPDRPGVAFADLRGGLPGWLPEAIGRAAREADAVLVGPHWGPNMTPEPVPHVRRAADGLIEAGATLVAGHSAHVFHGIGGPVLFDLGDFLDDYAVDPVLRNDHGLLFRVTLDEAGPVRLEALPIFLEFCRTRVAGGEESAWVRRRFFEACAALGTEVEAEGDRLVVSWR